MALVTLNKIGLRCVSQNLAEVKNEKFYSFSLSKLHNLWYICLQVFWCESYFGLLHVLDYMWKKVFIFEQFIYFGREIHKIRIFKWHITNLNCHIFLWYFVIFKRKSCHSKHISAKKWKSQPKRFYVIVCDLCPNPMSAYFHVMLWFVLMIGLMKGLHNLIFDWYN